jgi:altronate hydrolase
MDPNDEGFKNLQRVLFGFSGHQNFGAVVMVGLGCEVFQIASFKESFGLEEGKTFLSLVMQETGGSRKTIEEGVRRIEELLPTVNQAERETAPASELCIALQCGGSDGYSGITANPAMGAAVDLLVRHGGSAILAETQEIYGAEHLLTRRAASTEIGEKLIERIKWWEEYTARNGSVMDSPGYDPASITGEVASGANLVCFSTGRGSAFGFKPAPSVNLFM